MPDDVAIVNLYDTYGDGLTSGVEMGNSICMYVVPKFSGSSLSIYLAEHSQVVMVQLLFGCMDETAINFTPDANTDDGSCEYEVVLGCTDDEALVY